jgi:hypothetical protein
MEAVAHEAAAGRVEDLAAAGGAVGVGDLGHATHRKTNVRS